jgi:phage terminase large subunit GpA-like protein
MNYAGVWRDILEDSIAQLSDLKPSAWAEQNRIMSSDVSPIPGPFSYKNSPYTREIVDCLAQDHPAKIIAIMKGAQIGFSTGVIENGIGYIISQAPGNIMFNVGHDELVEEAVNKVDIMIDSCNLRSFIRPSVQRAKNMKTGDTNRRKEFPGGYLVCGVPNHKLYRNRSIQYGFIDDFEAAKGKTKEAGATTSMIEQRFAAYKRKMKLFYISTPELKSLSNIEPVYNLGDKRKFHTPCPCCGEFITWEWSTPMDGSDTEMAGIYYELDENSKLVEGSVGYRCQKCGDVFKDTNKDELLRAGIWKPTCEPSKPGYYSYHISSLYAPSLMFGWEDYVRQYLECCPPGQKRDEAKYKTFVNVVLGETYEETAEEIKATDLQKNNIRKYKVGVIPESLSEQDGNGKIILLTLACDLGGFPDDARLDYEIVGWSETGSSYSIDAGSIGTFVNREGSKKNKEDREHWSYELYHSRSVWPEVDKLLEKQFDVDNGTRKMKITMTGVDTGHFTNLAYAWLDKRNHPLIVALKGDKENKYRKFGVDTKLYKHGKERAHYYLPDVNLIKDEVAQLVTLRWDEGNDDHQPPGYMNYPQPESGKYSYRDFFSHYEAEHRVVESKDGEGIASKWVKKQSTSQNHFWDCRIYNRALREIFMDIMFKESKIKDGTWRTWANLITGKK